MFAIRVSVILSRVLVIKLERALVGCRRGGGQNTSIKTVYFLAVTASMDKEGVFTVALKTFIIALEAVGLTIARVFDKRSILAHLAHYR